METKLKTARLKKHYYEEVCPKLMVEFSVKNTLSLPKMTKIVVNTGSGEMAKSKELLESMTRDLMMITGLKPSIRKAKVSIAAFSLRKGMPVGLMVTLRGERMYAFCDRLFSLVLPRIRDFRGLAFKGLDRGGNYTLGISEHTIFPEIDLTKTSKPFGLEITIVSGFRGDRAIVQRFFELMGLPFEKKEK